MKQEKAHRCEVMRALQVRKRGCETKLSFGRDMKSTTLEHAEATDLNRHKLVDMVKPSTDQSTAVQ